MVEDPMTHQPRQWSIELASTGQQTRIGWTKESVKPGDKVALEIHPLRDGTRAARFFDHASRRNQARPWRAKAIRAATTELSVNLHEGDSPHGVALFLLRLAAPPGLRLLVGFAQLAL